MNKKTEVKGSEKSPEGEEKKTKEEVNPFLNKTLARLNKKFKID